MFIRRLLNSAAILLPILGASVSAQAGSLYFQGFESNTSGWTGGITQTPGSGSMPAADGSYYAVVQNVNNSYQPGDGSAGYTLFGNSSAPAYPGGPFVQSMDIYIDPTTPAPAIATQAAFWLDASPSSTDPNDVAHNGSTGYGAEHDFAFFYDGSSVDVVADNNTADQLATITTAGWYQFQFEYSVSDGTPTDNSQTTLSVADLNNDVLGSTTLANDFTSTDPSDPINPLQNQYLAGPGYDWLTVWQNNFSGNQLAIDDISAYTAPTPEPASILLIGGGLGLLCFFRFRNREARG